jgi:hypothetical protein
VPDPSADGGKKHERDAHHSYTVREAELGVEWQPFSSFELVTVCTYVVAPLRVQRTANKQSGACCDCRPRLTLIRRTAATLIKPS